ncbi:MAG TPA: hypothetical protein VML55_06070 [Planctomycetaceae bacterium]|nr:hypothetical protein [Planctomycetaceae bacterium]
MADEFPDDVQRLLSEHISSVAQLEVLLLLREQRERAWSAAEVAKALYTTPEMVAEQLADLERRGLLAFDAGAEPQYRYWPASPELDNQVSRLDTIYRERRVAVITYIYSQPLDKVRTFADAFRLRKDS